MSNDTSNQTTPTEPASGPVLVQAPTFVTAGMLEQWRVRKAELDVVLGAAGAEAADVARKIKAAEFLLNLKPGDRILIEAEVNEIGVNKRQPLVGVAFRYGTKITYSSVPVQLIRKVP